MIAVVQRVSSATVTAADHSASIGRGLLVLVGVERGDGPDDVEYIARKVREVRAFDAEGVSEARPNKHFAQSVQDIGAEVLVISQFTLVGDCRKGRRPSFDGAAPPEIAKPLYESIVLEARAGRHSREDGPVSSDDGRGAREQRSRDAASRQQKATLMRPKTSLRPFLVPWIIVTTLIGAVPKAHAQQRPLVTEDPEPIGAGRVLVEGGLEAAHDQEYPVSGLKGNVFRFPLIGVSVGLSSIAELQIDGGLYSRLNITSRAAAPLSSELTVTGDSTHDVEDTIVATKIRLVTEAASRPALGIRFATKLPNASNESGLGLDTTDFYASLLGAKTVQSIRLVVNLGVGILADPTLGHRQNDVFTYGFSFARAMTQQAEIVGEINGRKSTRSGGPFPGTESRSVLRLGGRYTRGMLRVDAAVFFGLTTIDPTIGAQLGFTYVFNAFKLP